MKKHVRIAALQCNFQTREQTLAMPEKWAQCGFNAEQLFHTHADLYSAAYDKEVHGELMAQYLENSRRAGLDTIVYMNCHIMGPFLKEHCLEWAVRNADGTYPMLYDTYYSCCYNSGWKDYFFKSLSDMRGFDIEGFFFDGPVALPCACSVCRAKFEKRLGKAYDDASEQEKKQFAFDNMLEFKEELHRHVKSLNPAWKMYFNEGLYGAQCSAKVFARKIATDDIIGSEGGFFFYLEPKVRPYWYCATTAKLAEAVADGRPTVIFFAGDHKPWGWYMHTPAETKLCYASALGNGASVWYGLHGNPDNLDTESGRAAQGMLHFDAKYDELYQDTRSLAEVAVFFSYDTSGGYRHSGSESDLYQDDGSASENPGDYTNAVQGAFALLEHLNIPYDVVTDLHPEAVMRYKAVLAPSLAMTGSHVRDVLAQFVAAGGTVFADGELGKYDENGKLRSDNLFAELAGFTPRNKVRRHGRFNYFKTDAGLYRPDNAFGWLPAPEWTLDVQPAGDAEVTGFANAPMAGRYAGKPENFTLPVMFARKTGKGVFRYFAGGFFEHYYGFQHQSHRELAAAILRKAYKPAFALANALPGIAMTVRESKGHGVLVHLTNYISATRPIQQSAEVANLLLRVPAEFQRAELLGSDEPLAVCNGEIRLPALREFMVIQLQ